MLLSCPAIRLQLLSITWLLRICLPDNIYANDITDNCIIIVSLTCVQHANEFKHVRNGEWLSYAGSSNGYIDVALVCLKRRYAECDYFCAPLVATNQVTDHNVAFCNIV
ncbi:conserved domain protein [Trichinella spiralis]|uniref:hypothetical protein n=1 Tax=Trichinella spiralis TaxID=6334 RepID=UPI0001EFD8EC|nr:conserved domain protein [Trichinella spiralis]